MNNGELMMMADGVNPDLVPKATLSNGARLPIIGMGTFGSDKHPGETVAAAVIEAATLGYRHFDCASVYGNEALIGQALRIVQKGGVARESLWITSKVWNDMHGAGDVVKSCKQSLKDLQLDYLDLYLVHWPFPNYHPQGVDGFYRRPVAKPYIHEEYMQVWSQMEELVRSGLVRNIGTCNMSAAKLKLLLRDCKIKPVANEMELHPHFQQPKLYDFMVAHKIQPIGFCPVGWPSRSERDRLSTDTCDIEDPVILKLADRFGVHPIVVCLMWAAKRGTVTIPFAVQRFHLASNLMAAVDNRLSDKDMRSFERIDRNCRLLKGQALLWRDGLTWEALWDENGNIQQ